MRLAARFPAPAGARPWVVVAMAAALVACGGGDDDHDDWTPPPGGGVITQAEAETWSRVGASGFALLDIAQSLMRLDMGDLASDELAAGQSRFTVDCGSSGRITVDYRKTPGVAVGDFVNLSYEECLSDGVQQDGERRLSVTGADRDNVYLRQTYRDYALTTGDVMKVELDGGALALTIGASNAPLRWRAEGLRGDVEGYSEQARRAYDAGDVELWGDMRAASTSQRMTVRFDLDVRHESGLRLRSVTDPDLVFTSTTTQGTVRLTADGQRSRVRNKLEGTHTVVRLDPNGDGRYTSSSVIDARLY